MAADGGVRVEAGIELKSQWSAVMHHNGCSSDERFESWLAVMGDLDAARESYAAMFAEIAWMRVLPDADVLAMMENPDPDALEPWRLECEARYVLKMPTKAQRLDWFARVEKKRGPAEAQRLRDEVMRLWKGKR
jgi:hypothetical protein